MSQHAGCGDTPPLELPFRVQLEKTTRTVCAASNKRAKAYVRRAALDRGYPMTARERFN